MTLRDRDKPYICVHCKKSFNSIPPLKPNECISGYTHMIVKKTDLERITVRR